MVLQKQAILELVCTKRGLLYSADIYFYVREESYISTLIMGNQYSFYQGKLVFSTKRKTKKTAALNAKGTTS